MTTRGELEKVFCFEVEFEMTNELPLSGGPVLFTFLFYSPWISYALMHKTKADPSNSAQQFDKWNRPHQLAKSYSRQSPESRLHLRSKPIFVQKSKNRTWYFNPGRPDPTSFVSAQWPPIVSASPAPPRPINRILLILLIDFVHFLLHHRCVCFVLHPIISV